MADYTCSVRTNYFRVTDEEKYKEIFSQLFGGNEEKVFDLTKEKNGKIYHGFGAYESVGCKLQDCDPEYCIFYGYQCFSSFLSDLQKILPEDEAFIYTEIGNEELDYLNAYSIVLTKDNSSMVDLRRSAIMKAREMLGNEDFSTETSF